MDITSYRRLRVLAGFAVVVLHSIYYPYLLFAKEMSERQIRVALVIHNNLMWAVPCFLMVTGALLLAKKKTLTLSYCVRRYVPRVLIALILFHIFDSIFSLIMQNTTITGQTLKEIATTLVQGKGWPHLWYLYLLIGLYLLMPFTKRALEASSRRERMGLLAILIFFLSILPIAKVGFDVAIGFTLPITTIFPTFLVLGYCMEVDVRRRRPWLGFASFLLGTLIITFFALYLRSLGYDALPYIASYASVAVILQAVGLYECFRSFDREEGSPSHPLKEAKQSKLLARLLRELDQCTFGIYLVHMFFVYGLFRYQNINLWDQPFLYAIVIIGIYVISFMLTWCLRKLPGLTKIL